MKKDIKKIIMFLFLLIYIFRFDAYAMKNDNINFQSITIDDGLSQSLVEYSEKKLWIGTKTGGLNIMDLEDYSMKQYNVISVK